MKRTALQRRTPLRPKLPAAWVRPARQIPAPSTLWRPRATLARQDAPLVASPKHEYIRSPALMKACRTLACMHCGASGIFAGVAWAHSNWNPHHKGGAIKADDIYIAALCFRCHQNIDQGSRLSEAERKSIWWLAHVKTTLALITLQRWPTGVPVPDVENCPWEGIAA